MQAKRERKGRAGCAIALQTSVEPRRFAWQICAGRARGRPSFAVAVDSGCPAMLRVLIIAEGNLAQHRLKFAADL